MAFGACGVPGAPALKGFPKAAPPKLNPPPFPAGAAPEAAPKLNPPPFVGNVAAAAAAGAPKLNPPALPEFGAAEVLLFVPDAKAKGCAGEVTPPKRDGACDCSGCVAKADAAARFW